VCAPKLKFSQMTCLSFLSIHYNQKIFVLLSNSAIFNWFMQLHRLCGGYSSFLLNLSRFRCTSRIVPTFGIFPLLNTSQYAKVKLIRSLPVTTFPFTRFATTFSGENSSCTRTSTSFRNSMSTSMDENMRQVR